MGFDYRQKATEDSISHQEGNWKATTITALHLSLARQAKAIILEISHLLFPYMHRVNYIHSLSFLCLCQSIHSGSL